MNPARFRLDGLCALVTGGSKGLGRAMAKALAGAGAAVMVTSRHLNEAEAAAEEIRVGGTKAVAYEADMSKAQAVEHMVRAAEDALGKIDILVNNAGVGKIVPQSDTTDHDWDLLMNVNLRGCFQCARAVVPGMMKRKFGRIINVGSVASTVSYPGLGAYVTSKHGLLGLTRSMALEWAAHGITANCLCPGFFETDMTKPVSDDPAGYQAVVAQTPMARWGRPDELDGAVIFLASPASSYVTGIALHVDGGWTAQ